MSDRRRHAARVLPSLGPAVLALAEADLLAPTVETSPNDGPRVREYLAAVGADAPADWGPAAVSAWILWAAAAAGRVAPVVGSADAPTLIAQFKLARRWIPIHQLAQGVVQPGMVVGYRIAPIPSVPKRRVGVVRAVLAAGASFEVIFGNAGAGRDRVAVEARAFTDPLFAGAGGL